MDRKLALAIFSVLFLALPVRAQWISDPGKAWIDISLYHQDTRHQFWFDGSEIRMFEEGHAITTSTYLTMNYGLIEGMDLWLQVPFIRSSFNDFVGERVSSGIGDPRLFLRIGPGLFSRTAFPLAFRLGVKAPVGSFEKDAEIIPLGEGQSDLEAHLELGQSDPKGRFYTSLALGYRYRFENTKSQIKPGNEWLGLITLGARRNSVTVDVLAEALVGGSPVVQGLNIETGKRRFFQITPRIGYFIGNNEMKVGLRLPLAGRNLPSGNSLYMGAFRKF